MMRTMRSGTPPSAGPIAGEARFGGFASLARGWVVAFLRLCVLGPRLRLVPAAGEARLGGVASLARGWVGAFLRLCVLGPRLRLVPGGAAGRVEGPRPRLAALRERHTL